MFWDVSLVMVKVRGGGMGPSGAWVVYKVGSRAWMVYELGGGRCMKEWRRSFGRRWRDEGDRGDRGDGVKSDGKKARQESTKKKGRRRKIERTSPRKSNHDFQFRFRLSVFDYIPTSL